MSLGDFDFAFLLLPFAAFAVFVADAAADALASMAFFAGGVFLDDNVMMIDGSYDLMLTTDDGKVVSNSDVGVWRSGMLGCEFVLYS